MNRARSIFSDVFGVAVSASLFLLALLWASPLANAQPTSLRFDRVEAKGLSQSSVKCFAQDSLGFLWLGTEDGLHRYDGYGLKVFRKDDYDPKSISDNDVTSIVADGAERLWVATYDGGLNEFDLRTEEFTRHFADPDDPNSIPSNRIHDLTRGEGDALWGASENGLFRFDAKSGEATVYQNTPNDPNSISHNECLTVLVDYEGNVWAGTLGGGLNKLDPNSGSVERFRHVRGDPTSLPDDVVLDLYEDRAGTLWIGTRGGLCRVNSRTGRFETFVSSHHRTIGGSSNRVRSVIEDDRGMIWGGYFGGGVDIFDPETETFTHNHHNPYDPYSISNDYVWPLFEDRGGIIWIGPYGGGVNKYDPRKNQFEHYSSVVGSPYSLSSSFVWSVYCDEEEKELWAGTFEGVNCIDMRTGKTTVYRHVAGDPTSLSDDEVRVVFKDRRGDLWIGTRSGLNRFNRRTNSFKRYKNVPGDSSSLAGNFVWSIAEDSEGGLWIGSFGGVSKYRPGSDDFLNYRYEPNNPNSVSSNSIRAVYPDRKGYIWVGTNDSGLCRLDPNTGIFNRYKDDPSRPGSLSGNIVRSVYQDSRGVIWVGADGLNRFDPKTGSFQVVDRSQGMPDDVLYMILEDERGNLWISSNRGVVKYDPITKTARVFDGRNGLQSDEFNAGAAYKTSDGKMFFGGVNGISAFYPEEVKIDRQSPVVEFTDVLVLNQSVKPGATDSPLKYSAPVAEEIRLSFEDYVVTFEFAALSFASPTKNKYACFLEGFDKGWRHIGERHSATYTNLPAGEYVFKVRASNSHGVWTRDPASIRVVVTPPMWRAWWAYLLYFTIAAGVVFGYIQWRTNTQKKELIRQQEELEREREVAEALRESERSMKAAKEKAIEMSKLKSSFLANMSHELRTPMNGILGFSQILKTEIADVEMLEMVEKIESSGLRLMETLNSILDFSILETDELPLRITNVDLEACVESAVEYHSEAARRKGLRFVFKADAESFRVSVDERYFKQIVKNLLDNAVKFTKEGYIETRVFVEERGGATYGAVSVLDTGVGIDPNYHDLIFEEFRQASEGLSRSYEGAGLGLTIAKKMTELMRGAVEVKSKPGVGSVFTVRFPGVAGAPKPKATEAGPQKSEIERKPRILIIEDNETNVDVARLFLQHDYDVEAAFDGESGVRMASEKRYDLILLDINLGEGIDGIETARRIRALGRYDKAPIIALTGYAMAGDREEIFDRGRINDYLAKPYKREDLLQIVEMGLHSGPN